MHYLMRLLNLAFVVEATLCCSLFAIQKSDSCIAVELQKCRRFLMQEEAQNKGALKKELLISDSAWHATNALVEKAKESLWGLLKKPLINPVRDKKIPYFIVAWLEEIAVLYGIHPKSFHIKLMQVSKSDLEKKSFSSAHILYPSYSIDKNLCSIVFHSDFTLCLHPKFIENFEYVRIKTLYHEMMHIRTLNGFENHLFFSLLKAFGYDAQKTRQSTFIQLKATKLMERNTDLFAMLEGESLAHVFCSFYGKDFKKLNLSLADYGDPSHFGKALMHEWGDLICLLYKGVFFGSNTVKEKVALLQQRQNAAIGKERSI